MAAWTRGLSLTRQEVSIVYHLSLLFLKKMEWDGKGPVEGRPHDGGVE